MRAFFISLPLALLLGAALLAQGCGSACGEGCGWSGDLEAARARAAKERQPVLVLFTHPSCPNCRLLESEVLRGEAFHKKDGGFLRVQVMLTARATPQQRVEWARAHLSVVPTLVFLDRYGRSYARIEGYKPGTSQAVAEKVLGLLSLPPKAKKKGDELARLKKDRERGYLYGATLTAERLEKGASPELLRTLAPLLVAPRIAKGGRADDLLELLAADPKSRKQWFQAVQEAAAWSRMAGRCGDSARYLTKLLKSKDLPCQDRLSAEVTLGDLCQKRKAPCRAKRHYERALECCTRLDGKCPQNQSLTRILRRKIEQQKCCPPPCRCPDPTKLSPR